MAPTILVIGLAYGHRGMPVGQLPVGKSNEALAYQIEINLYFKEKQFFICVQHEIGTALWKNHNRAPSIQVTEHRIQGQYLNTLEVLEQIQVACKAQGLDPVQCEIWVFCHKDHVSGINMLMRKLGLVPARYITTNVYDLLSAQWWTRNKLFAWVIKIKRGLQYFFRGELDLRGLFRRPQ